MIKGVLLREDGQILKKLVRSTQDDGMTEDFTWGEEIRRIVQELKASSNEEMPIGICAPGLPDPSHQWVAYMPGRLAGLENFHWGPFLREKIVRVLNDANAAGLAEYHFGAGQGHRNLILLTLGTGVGGAIIIDGNLYKGWLNRAGHLGHISQHPFGPAGIVHLPGTLEMAIGNATIQQRSKGKFNSTESLVKAYQRGDHWATLVWLDSVKGLAIGMSSLVNILSPELFILSGGITQAGKNLFHPLKEFMDLYEWKPGRLSTPIVPAHFEAHAGAVGAACFVLFNGFNTKSNT